MLTSPVPFVHVQRRNPQFQITITSYPEAGFISWTPLPGGILISGKIVTSDFDCSSLQIQRRHVEDHAWPGFVLCRKIISASWIHVDSA